MGEGSYILSPCQLFPHIALLKPACQWGTTEGMDTVGFHSVETKEAQKKITKAPAFVVTFLAVGR